MPMYHGFADINKMRDEETHAMQCWWQVIRKCIKHCKLFLLENISSHGSILRIEPYTFNEILFFS